MESLLVAVVIIGVVAFIANRRAQTQRRELEAAELEKVKAFAAEDVTKFGEELQRLDTDVAGHDLDEATRQDYERALDEYDTAKKALDTAQRPDDIKHITSILEDGKYAVACVRARIKGGVEDHLGKASAATFTAASTSALLARATLAWTSPVAGLNTSPKRPLLPATSWPPTK